MNTRPVILSMIVVFAVSAAERAGNWTGKFAPCERHAELLKSGPMNLGVRFSTSNPELAAEFARAMDFWTTVLDMTWSREDTCQCAIQVVDGQRGLFKPGEAARAQFPNAASFQGWIAFNPRLSLSRDDLFFMAVHELGHLLGLKHSTKTYSVMYFLSTDGPSFLDNADLVALAARHQLRPAVASSISFVSQSLHRQ